MLLLAVSWTWGQDTHPPVKIGLDAEFGVKNSTSAQAIILVANEREGSILVREVAKLPPEEQVPLISHWGVTGGDFVGLTDGAASRMDFSVVQTFSFFRADPEVARNAS